jgi:hypothetical protein
MYNLLRLLDFACFSASAAIYIPPTLLLHFGFTDQARY